MERVIWVIVVKKEGKIKDKIKKITILKKGKGKMGHLESQETHWVEIFNEIRFIFSVKSFTFKW